MKSISMLFCCCLPFYLGGQPTPEFTGVPSVEYYAPSGLDDNHWEALGQIATDMANLQNKATTRSRQEMIDYPRINLSGDWTLTCLANLFTLLRNQGINRTYFNRGAAASLNTVMNLIDVITLPFSGLRRFLTSQAVQEAIKEALSADEPEDEFIENIKEMLEENGESFPEGAEGDKLEAQLRDLYELRALALENTRLPDDAKWEYWTFDPGNSTMDDLGEVFGMTNSNPLIPSTAMVRMGTVPEEDNPLEDPEDDEASVAYKLVLKGVANRPYPANSACAGQIEEYDVEVTNYGHYEDGKFVSDYIVYDIYLDCCKDDDGDISYEGFESTPIAYLPGDDYQFLVGGIAGLGIENQETSGCLGLTAQYFPDASVGPCGSRPAVGLKTAFDIGGTSNDASSFRRTNLNITPQALLFNSLTPRVSYLGGIGVPINIGRNTFMNSGSMSTFTDNISSIGVSAIGGLAIDFDPFQLQVQTDLLSWHRITTTPNNNPSSSFTDNQWGLGLNKGNEVTVAAGFRF